MMQLNITNFINSQITLKFLEIITVENQNIAWKVITRTFVQDTVKDCCPKCTNNLKSTEKFDEMGQRSYQSP